MSLILAFTKGQWLQMKITKRVLLLKSFKEYIFPSTPIKLKSGALDPVFNI